MKLIVPPLIISESEGFEQDLFGRKAFGESLKNVIINSDDALVISLDGMWGEGKSTFVRMWQGILTEDGIPNIYIDAFSNDYVDNAFISVASAINSYIESNAKDSSSVNVSTYKEKAKQIGIKLLSLGAKIGVKAITLGAFEKADIELVKSLGEDIASNSSDFVSDLIEQQLSSHSADVQSFELFRKLLSELPNEIEGNDGKPLVIIIDELDRCRPSYAVDFIEKIKHFFSVKNVVFLLVMHKQQLEVAVKNIYGSEIDAHSYLQKFINIETSLPKSTDLHSMTDIAKYCEYLLNAHEISHPKVNSDNLQRYIISLASYYNLYLRQLEKVYTNISIFAASSNNSTFFLPPLLSFLLVIKVIKPDIYAKLDKQKLSYNQLVSSSEFPDYETANDLDGRLATISELLQFSLLTEEEYSQIPSNERIHLNKSITRENDIERHELIPFFIKKLNLFSVSSPQYI